MKKKSILELYNAFSNYKYNKNMTFCEHCNEGEDVKKLGNKELLNLNGSDLNYYISSAILTMGDVNDYKHFLPRILHLFIIEEESLAVDLEIVGKRLSELNWKLWPKSESEIIEIILEEQFYDLMKRYTPSENRSYGLYDWMTMISLCESDITDYVNIFEKSKDIIKIKYMIDLNYSLYSISQFNPYIESEVINNKLISWVHGYKESILAINDCLKIGYRNVEKFNIVKNLTTAST